MPIPVHQKKPVGKPAPARKPAGFWGRFGSWWHGNVTARAENDVQELKNATERYVVAPAEHLYAVGKQDVANGARVIRNTLSEHAKAKTKKGSGTRFSGYGNIRSQPLAAPSQYNADRPLAGGVAMSDVPVAQRVNNLNDESNQWLSQALGSLWDGTTRWFGDGPRSNVITQSMQWEKEHPNATLAQEDAALTRIEQRFDSRKPEQVFLDWWHDVHSSPTSNPILATHLAYQNWAAPPATVHNPHPKGALPLIVQGIRQGAPPFAGGFGGDAANPFSQSLDDVLSYGSVYPLHFGVDVGTTIEGARALPGMAGAISDAGAVVGSRVLADAGLIGRGTASRVAANVVGRRVIGAMASSTPARDAALAGGSAYMDGYVAARRLIAAARAQRAAKAGAKSSSTTPIGSTGEPSRPYHVFSEIEPGNEPDELQRSDYTVNDYYPTLESISRWRGEDGEPIGQAKALDIMNRAAVTGDLPGKLTDAAGQDGHDVAVQGATAGYGAYKGKARPNIYMPVQGNDAGIGGFMGGLVRGASQESAIAMREPVPEDYDNPDVNISNVFRLVFPRPLTMEEHEAIADALYNDPELQLNGRPLLEGHSAFYDPETGEYALLHGDMFWDTTDPKEWSTAVYNQAPYIMNKLRSLGHNDIKSGFAERRVLTNAFTPAEGLAGEGGSRVESEVERGIAEAGSTLRGGGTGRETLPQVWKQHLSDTFSQLRQGDEGAGGQGLSPTPPPPQPPAKGQASGNPPGANSLPGD